MLPAPSDPSITEKPVRVVNVTKQPVLPLQQRKRSVAVLLPTKAPTTKAVQKLSIARSRVLLQRKASTPQTSTFQKLKPPLSLKPSKLLQLAKPAAPVPPKVEPKVENVVADFSELAKAQPGCQMAKECWQVEETQWRDVASQLTQKLESQGYHVGKLDDLDDETGIGIYRVIAKNGEKKFLHLLLTDRGTVYVLDPNQLTRKQLEQRMAG